MTRARVSLPITALVFGYAFLYAPIAVLVMFSFNESRAVAVWGGFSWRWYGALLDNAPLLGAAWLSLKIAAASATAAVALGTLAAYAIVRYRRFPGRGLFAGLVLAPLVMPEVIVGLALLLLFVWLETWLGWPAGRSALTIGIAHTTLAIAYAAAVVRARLVQLDPDLAAAAADLGARPLAGFRSITLPLLAPALAAAWLLAFTLSLDDLVIASFVSGPGSSTLPLVVFSSVRLGVSPQINALATLFLVAVGSAIALAGVLIYRRERRRVLPAD